MEDRRFRALIVWLIVDGRTEVALEKLAEHYLVETPKIKVGLPKGHRTGTSGCYEAKTMTISVRDSKMLRNPLTILHEFYHHLRTGADSKHKGTESHASKFAVAYLQAFSEDNNEQQQILNKKDQKI